MASLKPPTDHPCRVRHDAYAAAKRKWNNARLRGDPQDFRDYISDLILAALRGEPSKES